MALSVNEKMYLTERASTNHSATSKFQFEIPSKMAVGALLGAGFFVVAVVCGACMMITPFKPPNWPVTRDLVTYLWALYWLIQCMYKGRVELQDSAGFLGYYLCYVLVVVLWECVTLHQDNDNMFSGHVPHMIYDYRYNADVEELVGHF